MSEGEGGREGGREVGEKGRKERNNDLTTIKFTYKEVSNIHA